MIGNREEEEAIRSRPHALRFRSRWDGPGHLQRMARPDSSVSHITARVGERPVSSSELSTGGLYQECQQRSQTHKAEEAQEQCQCETEGPSSQARQLSAYKALQIALMSGPRQCHGD